MHLGHSTLPAVMRVKCMVLSSPNPHEAWLQSPQIRWSNYFRRLGSTSSSTRRKRIAALATRITLLLRY